MDCVQLCSPNLRHHLQRWAGPELVAEHSAADRAALLAPRVAYVTGEIPITQGCLICGVGHQLASAVLVAQQGLHSPQQQLSGYLCRSYSEAVEHSHAMGATALMRALVASLTPQGVQHLGWGQLRVDGLIGWGAIVALARQQDKPDPKANAVSWSHLGNVDALKEQLSAALG